MTAARLTCYVLLPEAESQARKGQPRLLAEILQFLQPRPSPRLIL